MLLHQAQICRQKNKTCCPRKHCIELCAPPAVVAHLQIGHMGLPQQSVDGVVHLPVHCHASEFECATSLIAVHKANVWYESSNDL